VVIQGSSNRISIVRAADCKKGSDSWVYVRRENLGCCCFFSTLIHFPQIDFVEGLNYCGPNPVGHTQAQQFSEARFLSDLAMRLEVGPHLYSHEETIDRCV